MPLISYCPCIGTQRVRGSCALFPDKSSPTGIARSEFCVIFPGEASCRTLALPSQSMRQICATFGASQSPEKETVQAVQRSYANENSRRQDPATRHHGAARYWSQPSHSVVAMGLRPDRLHGITGPHDTGHNRHTLWSPWLQPDWFHWAYRGFRLFRAEPRRELCVAREIRQSRLFPATSFTSL